MAMRPWRVARAGAREDKPATSRYPDISVRTTDPPVTPFDRLGRFVVRRARWVLGAWAVLLLLALPLVPRVPSVLSAGGFILDDLESARAKSTLEAELGVPPSALVVVFSSPDLIAGTPAFESAVGAAMADVPTAPHVT